MYLIIAHTHLESGPGLQVARRANGTPALYATKENGKGQADHWNRILARFTRRTGLTQNYFYHCYEIRSD